MASRADGIEYSVHHWKLSSVLRLTFPTIYYGASGWGQLFGAANAAITREGHELGNFVLAARFVFVGSTVAGVVLATLFWTVTMTFLETVLMMFYFGRNHRDNHTQIHSDYKHVFPV